MFVTRFVALALLAFLIGLPVLAQEEPDDATAPSTDVAPAEAPPPDAAPPTEEAPPQPTSAPSAVPAEPTARPTAQPPTAPGPGSVAFSDNFDDVTRPNFPLSSSNPVQRTQGYIDGTYEIVVGQGGAFSEQIPGTFSNSTLAVDVRVSDGPQMARAYFACRRAGDTGYQLEILPEPTAQAGGGAANIQRYVGPRFRLLRLETGSNVTLLDQGPVPAILPKGEVNHIEFTCAGSTLTGTVNGTEIFSALDATWTTGRQRFGVSGVGTRGRFDNLSITLR
jgi:hypothetical protein